MVGLFPNTTSRIIPAGRIENVVCGLYSQLLESLSQNPIPGIISTTSKGVEVAFQKNPELKKTGKAAIVTGTRQFKTYLLNWEKIEGNDAYQFKLEMMSPELITAEEFMNGIDSMCGYLDRNGYKTYPK
jgi:hypothetical protein